MAEIDETIARVEGELQRYSLALAVEFQKAIDATQMYLTAEEVEVWADEGLAIARNSFRSWEAALEYYRASPSVSRKLDFASLMDWAGVGRELSGYSATIASSYFGASPEILSSISPFEISDWVRLGRRLYRETWKSGLLCGQFFDLSPVLLRHLSLLDLGRFVDFLEVLARLSFDTAVECLGLASATFPLLDQNDTEPFIQLATFIAERNWKVAKTYFREGPQALALVIPRDRPLFFSMVGRVARVSRDEAHAFFMDVPKYLSELDRDVQGEMLKLAESFVITSPKAAAEFLKNSSVLLNRLSMKELREWVSIGLEVLQENPEAGTAFFGLNSNRATLAIQRVSRGAELGEVRDVLRVYCKALTGRNLSLLASQELVEKGIGWASVEKPTTEGNAIFLPPYLDEYEAKTENREAYKVLVTHQAAHLEFGTFEFSFAEPSGLFDDLRLGIEAALAVDRPTISDFERFFDLFRDRRLARDVFTVLEDARVDARVRNEYRGIRKGYDRVQRHSLTKRLPIASLPLRQGIIEFLIQLSLDGTATFAVPCLYAERFASVAALFKQLQLSDATVEDSAEATIRVYAILRSVANLLFLKEDLMDLNLAEAGDEIAPLSVEDFLAIDGNTELESAGELYVSPEGVDFRGELKPELVQTMMKLRQGKHKDGEVEGFPIPLELLKELLAKSMDIEILDILQGDIDASSGLFITNLMKEHGRMKASKTKKKGKREPTEDSDDYEEMAEDDSSESYYYDEWDFRANDYRPNWCRLKEQLVQEGTTDFFDNTLREYAGLANEVKRQFEMLKPEQFKKLKRLYDGEEFDLDHVVELVVEKKAGHSPSDKVYTRRNKIDRDISVALLLDMSASTDEQIKEPENSSLGWWDDDWISNRRMGQPWMPPIPEEEKGKRIIDVEKESIVLLIRALEAIGDRYGLYGFSGYGRDNVEFYVIKDLYEDFDDRIKRRIDKVSPIRGTRMGPAIRHCISKLEDCEAKLRLLILVSDGRPQDHDYGKDRTEKEYAIHDTRMALLEAKRKNIVPFCLTVDKAGQDYLKTMMGDMGYEVVNDIENLPKRLPSLYRRLTT